MENADVVKKFRIMFGDDKMMMKTHKILIVRVLFLFRGICALVTLSTCVYRLKIHFKAILITLLIKHSMIESWQVHFNMTLYTM